MLQFKLSINLGNDAMQSGMDIAAALNRVARRFNDIAEVNEVEDSGYIMDANGNTVGEYEVTTK